MGFFSRNVDGKSSRFSNFMDRWKTFFGNIMMDYKEGFREIRSGFRARPIRSTVLSSFALAAWYANRHNPTQMDFIASHMERNLDLTLVPGSIRNPRSEQFHENIDQLSDLRQIRRFNLGLASVIWRDSYSDQVGSFKTRCKYLTPSIIEIGRYRIIDIGFLDRWWFCEKSMIDYDVNPDEWDSQGRPLKPQL